MKKNILAVTLIAVMLIAGCAVDKNPVPDPSTIVSDAEQSALDSYIGAFGHVRVLGDIDHILKGTMDGTMKLSGAISWNDTKTELTIPLALAKYDFDGHKNPDDPEPEKYTRLATGDMTLVLTGALNAEGTGFVANGYRFEGVDVTLSCDTSNYILLNLPELAIEADELSGIFTTKGGIARSSVTVSVAEGKAAGITNVDTPKFGTPSGSFTVNGKVGAVL